jgi:hypothetical protein
MSRTSDVSDEVPLSPGEPADEDDLDLTSDSDAPGDEAPLPAEDDRQIPLMRLPPEVRLNVYDCLFTDLTIDRQRQVADLRVYHHPFEWPDNDFSAYLNLLLTCKEVHKEAKSLWEKMYIPHCCFYFWKTPDLYRVARLLSTLDERYQRMRYALRTRTPWETGPYLTDFIDDVSTSLMSKQSGSREDYDEYTEFHWGWPSIRWSNGTGVHWLEEGRLPYTIYARDTETLARADFPGLNNCSISAHEHFHGGRYLLMTGKFGDIVWGDYDAPTAHAKMMIWEEWERREYPRYNLVKSEIVLTWRAQALSGYDETWVALGGDPEDLVRISHVQENLGLDTWLKEGD